MSTRSGDVGCHAGCSHQSSFLIAATTWGLIGLFATKKISAVGVATGAVAGLVAITPAAGAVNALGAIAIGLGAGIICYLAVELIHRTNLDDALDVFAVHGVGGILGTLLCGLLATDMFNGRGLADISR